MSFSRLILLRHGQTDFNRAGRMQGRLDTELTALGRRQAADAAGLLRGRGIARVVSSDLSRAADTAAAVADGLDLGVSFDARFRETALGEWQGKARDEVDEAYPGQRARWRLDPGFAPPGGESRLDVAARARAGLEEALLLPPEAEGETLLVVAHGGVISALTASLLDAPTDSYPWFVGLNNCHWAQLGTRAALGAGSRWFLEAWIAGDETPGE
ncbi:histidine phosphatase family protein [Corynebacterium otitidis]|uniref:histidine phosphatase family protein n=1 Tax=Corynebacterium otitidis TaxID=29321 RepID=UPI0006279988|nr:histidine phosphatase family protein [Corynebacterium otitidis]KKO83065.1 histidine phosphatase [Corynebacterium otitidis]